MNYDAGKKITLIGYAAAALAALAAFVAYFALAFCLSYDFYESFDNISNIVNIIAMLIIAAGAVISFVAEKNIAEVALAGGAFVTFIITLVGFSNLDAFTDSGFFTMLIMNGLSAAVFAGIGLKTMMKGNQQLGLLLLGVFAYFLVIVPIFLSINLSDEIWCLYLAFNAGIKAVGHGVAIVAANQED